MSSDETLIYHPPKKEPSIFNEWALMGLLMGIFNGAGLGFVFSLTLGVANGAILGGLEYLEQEKQQKYGKQGDVQRYRCNYCGWRFSASKKAESWVAATLTFP